MRLTTEAKVPVTARRAAEFVCSWIPEIDTVPAVVSVHVPEIITLPVALREASQL